MRHVELLRARARAPRAFRVGAAGSSRRRSDARRRGAPHAIRKHGAHREQVPIVGLCCAAHVEPTRENFGRMRAPRLLDAHAPPAAPRESALRTKTRARQPSQQHAPGLTAPTGPQLLSHEPSHARHARARCGAAPHLGLFKVPGRSAPPRPCPGTNGCSEAASWTCRCTGTVSWPHTAMAHAQPCPPPGVGAGARALA